MIGMARNGNGRAMGADEGARQRHADERVDLRLYVLGASVRSVDVVAHVKDICERYLPGRYDLKVIDLYQQPELARADQIIAVPTLLKVAPAPLRRVVGDLSDANSVLHALGIAAA